MKRSHTQKLRKVVHFFLFCRHFLYCSARAFSKIVIVCVYWRLHTPYSRKYIWYFLLSICFINRARLHLVCHARTPHNHSLLLLLFFDVVVAAGGVVVCCCGWWCYSRAQNVSCLLLLFLLLFWLSVCAFGLFVLFASSSSLLGFFIRFWMCIMKCSKTTNV